LVKSGGDMNVKNNKYEITTDRMKNRIYIALLGFWASRAEVPNYLSDIEKAAKELRKGFTVVVDITNVKPWVIEINALQEEAQKFLMKAGISNAVEVVADADRLKKMTVNQISSKTGIEKKMFPSIEEADRWLDSQKK
jgi:hypothetical protein